MGSSGLRVSRIAFGCEPLGGTDWGTVDEKLAMEAVAKALDLGVNVFDTADVYGLGHSEEVLARALASHRHDVVIVTKFGVNWRLDRENERAKVFYDSSPGRVMEAVENSLRRLRIDCIPLYLIHWPDYGTPFEQTTAALQKCIAAGKVRCLGVSNFSAWDIRAVHRMVPLAVAEFQYNLIDRRAEEDLLPTCQELGISTLIYGPLAQGLLTGKYDAHACFAANDRRHRLSHFQAENLTSHLQTVERVQTVTIAQAKRPSQVAIRWVLDNSSVSVAITGAKSPAQVEENLGALDWRLSVNDYQYLNDGTRNDAN